MMKRLMAMKNDFVFWVGGCITNREKKLIQVA